MTSKKNIEILRVTHLRGPNIWTYRPVIEAWVNIGELEDHPSNTLPGFYERLVALLPGLVEHHCSPGVRGGFLQRVREGTWTRAQAAKFHLADEMKEHYQERYEGIEYVKPEPLALLWTGLLQDALGTVDWEDAAECYLPDEAKDALSE